MRASTASPRKSTWRTVPFRTFGACGSDAWIRTFSGRIDRVTLHGNPARRTPTALFSVEGRSGREVYEHLATRDVNAPAGSFYAILASRWMGLGDDGAVRAGLAPYTNDDDVDRLLEGVAAHRPR